jgi:hypothetical protein
MAYAGLSLTVALRTLHIASVSRLGRVPGGERPSPMASTASLSMRLRRKSKGPPHRDAIGWASWRLRADGHSRFQQSAAMI